MISARFTYDPGEVLLTTAYQLAEYARRRDPRPTYDLGEVYL